MILVVRPERIELGDKAKKSKNSFSVRVRNILYKGPCLEYYVVLENSQEIRIRVESKNVSQENPIDYKITIGWNESDSVVLKRESK